jgi:hypothetical protein
LLLLLFQSIRTTYSVLNTAKTWAHYQPTPKKAQAPNAHTPPLQRHPLPVWNKASNKISKYDFPIFVDIACAIQHQYNVCILPIQSPPTNACCAVRLSQPPWRAESESAEAICLTELPQTIPRCKEYEGTD